MAERSPMPVFGNVITIKLHEAKNRIVYDSNIHLELLKPFFTGTRYFDSIINKNFLNRPKKQFTDAIQYLTIKRKFSSNEFYPEKSQRPFSNLTISFVTNSYNTSLEILGDSLNTKFGVAWPEGKNNMYGYNDPYSDLGRFQIDKWYNIHSQPTDSVLKPMMHRSDNFFAEQSLLMVSNERLGVMNDAMIIDTLLKTDFKDLPQKPRWADGSGLSRYNLFTPQDFVAILKKMKNEFGMERIKVILPTGGTGTISNYYKADSNFIFAKTGTLSGVVAFSGFLYTKKGKLLIFSTLVNNHQASSTAVRRAVEKFIQGIRNKY